MHRLVTSEPTIKQLVATKPTVNAFKIIPVLLSIIGENGPALSSIAIK
jgi:hypothetical protein